MENWKIQIQILLQLCHELVANLHDNAEWQKEHDKKLTRIGKIAGVLQKLQKIVVEIKPEENSISAAEDDKIIADFFARYAIKSNAHSD